MADAAAALMVNAAAASCNYVKVGYIVAGLLRVEHRITK